MLCLAASFSQAYAQDSVLGRGDAVVTGFSGIKPSNVPLKPGTNPLDEFFIDLNGPSAQILSLAVPGGAPSGQLISTPAKLQVKASQIGQVFATALDDGQGAQGAEHLSRRDLRLRPEYRHCPMPMATDGRSGSSPVSRARIGWPASSAPI